MDYIGWRLKYRFSLNQFLFTSQQENFGAHAQEGYCSCPVCLSLLSHISPLERLHTSVHPENTVTYSAGNGGRNFVEISLKLLRCRDTPLPAL